MYGCARPYPTTFIGIMICQFWTSAAVQSAPVHHSKDSTAISTAGEMAVRVLVGINFNLETGGGQNAKSYNVR